MQYFSERQFPREMTTVPLQARVPWFAMASETRNNVNTQNRQLGSSSEWSSKQLCKQDREDFRY